MRSLKLSQNVLGISIVYFCLVADYGMGQNMSDQHFLDNFDEVISDIACKASETSSGAEMKVNLARYSTREELAKMAFWNYGNDFSRRRLEFGWQLNWKRDLLDHLLTIFLTSCPASAVPAEYLFIFREFIMIYFNSVEPDVPTNNTEAWNTVKSHLSGCRYAAQPYELVFKKMEVTGIRGRVGNIVEVSELYPPEEKADVVYAELDQVVENLWWLFTHAVGRCYWVIPQQAAVIPKLKELFLHDILKPLMNRWADPGPLQDFGPIVGSYNVARIQRNIRFCVTAGYFLNGITELQMVRPLRVGHVHEGRNTVLNRKTGATFQ